MSIVHIRATTKGTTPVFIRPADQSTQNKWKFHQINLHCAATFTDPSTFTVRIRNHESTAYDSILLQSSISTAATVLQDLLWIPDRPISLVGKDALSLTFTGVSAACPWGYDVVVEV